MARAGDYFTLLLLFKLFLQTKAFEWFGNKEDFFFIPMENIALDEKRLLFSNSLRSNKNNLIFPFQILPGQKMTEVTPRDLEASLILPTTGVKETCRLVKKL